MGYFKFFLEQLRQVNKSETAIKFGEAVVKDTLTGGSGVIVASDVTEKSIDWLIAKHRSFRQSKETDNLHTFIHATINREDEFGINFSLSNFEALINKILAEDNERKSNNYVNLAIGLSKRDDLSEGEKNQYIYMLSDLSIEDLELARKYYIYGNYDLVGYEYQFHQLEMIHEPANGRLLRNTNKLIFNGLIYNPNNRASQKGYYKNTDTLNQFARLIFDESELEAEYINEVEKERYHILALKNRFIKDEIGEFFISLMSKKGLVVKIIDKKDMDEYLYYGDSFVTGNPLTEIRGSRETKKFILSFFHDYDALKTHKTENSKSSVNCEIEVENEPTTKQINNYLTEFANRIEKIKKYYDEQKNTST
ncbi:hypothetical protein [Proteus mirabilis]|uniref:hypothetical protein n=1 Tax=Proteus mirabilis TaxID=584 RepID=UPI00061D14E4|nr:hypothetical protein [Proteus mirabilis]KKC60036.1 hypothetical protein WG83_06215 [Proteus mirabilis]MCT0127350.1 hypothetical protein [Proteus mirabilis]MDF7351941.1 hypothetical protein [Proteus mirabilis]WFC08950.1 hypothetical protein PG663_10665 [Proteus mirabilis]HEK2042034.1 hypothetical protein [Proteus mirabilis]